MQCPDCGEEGSLYSLDLTAYPLTQDAEGNVETDFGNPEDPPDWARDQYLNPKIKTSVFCWACKHWVEV